VTQSAPSTFIREKTDAIVTARSRRNRLIYFRVSEEEFEQIIHACKSKGARNVSELARAAVQEFIKTDKTESDKLVVDTIRALGAVVEDIKQTVQQIASTTRAAGDGTSVTPVSKRHEQSRQEPLTEAAVASRQEALAYPEGNSNNEHD
jgi:hypothetical protein